MKKLLCLIIVILIFIITRDTVSDSKRAISNIPSISITSDITISPQKTFTNNDIDFYYKEMTSIDNKKNNIYIIKKEANVSEYGLDSLKSLDSDSLEKLLITIDSALLVEAKEYISNKDYFLYAIYAKTNLGDYTFNHFFIGTINGSFYVSFYDSFKEQKFYYIDTQTFLIIESLFNTFNSTSIYSCEQSFKKCISKDAIASDGSVSYEYTDNEYRYEYYCDDIYPYSDFLPAYKISYYVYTYNDGAWERTYSYTYGINMMTGKIITGF